METAASPTIWLDSRLRLGTGAAANSVTVVVSGLGESKRPRYDGALGALPVSHGFRATC